MQMAPDATALTRGSGGGGAAAAFAQQGARDAAVLAEMMEFLADLRSRATGAAEQHGGGGSARCVAGPRNRACWLACTCILSGSRLVSKLDAAKNLEKWPWYVDCTHAGTLAASTQAHSFKAPRAQHTPVGWLQPSNHLLPALISQR